MIVTTAFDFADWASVEVGAGDVALELQRTPIVCFSEFFLPSTYSLLPSLREVALKLTGYKPWLDLAIMKKWLGGRTPNPWLPRAVGRQTGCKTPMP
jgi:hypothetical protein